MISQQEKHIISLKHLAIIMDGNGRWAKERGYTRTIGHIEGVESVRVIVNICHSLSISYLTLYTFSEENWNRPNSEIATLMKLLEHFLNTELQTMLDKSIRLNVIGNLNKLPTTTSDLLLDTIEATKDCVDMILTLAISYSGRSEIVRAVQYISQIVKEGILTSQQINEEILSKYLYTISMPDPDLLIRTSGEMRISNFLLWQLAYTEFYFTHTKWPDFREDELMIALESYNCRRRRFGRVKE